MIVVVVITMAGHFVHRNGQMKRPSRWPCPKQGAVHGGEPPLHSAIIPYKADQSSLTQKNGDETSVAVRGLCRIYKTLRLLSFAPTEMKLVIAQ